MVTPWGEARPFRTLAELRAAVAKEPEEDPDEEPPPESEPAPLSLSGALIEELPTPIVPIPAMPRPSRPAPAPAETTAPLFRKVAPPPMPAATPAPPRARSLAPPLPAQPFALSRSLRPATADPEATAGPAMNISARVEEDADRSVDLPEVPSAAQSDAMVYGTAVGPPPSRRMLIGGAIALGVVAFAGVYLLLAPPPKEAPATAGLVSNLAKPALLPSATMNNDDIAPVAAAPAETTTATAARATSISTPTSTPTPTSTTTSTSTATTTATQTPTAGSVTGPPLPSDPGALLQAGAAAQQAGDFFRAQRAYRALLAVAPNDVDGLSGLGDAARGLGNRSDAIASYQRALAISPAYYPALLGLADTLWENGDHAGARTRYADIVDRFPTRKLPARVKERMAP
jgi:TolA-binding protein